MATEAGTDEHPTWAQVVRKASLIHSAGTPEVPPLAMCPHMDPEALDFRMEASMGSTVSALSGSHSHCGADGHVTFIDSMASMNTVCSMLRAHHMFCTVSDTHAHTHTHTPTQARTTSPRSVQLTATTSEHADALLPPRRPTLPQAAKAKVKAKAKATKTPTTKQKPAVASAAAAAKRVAPAPAASAAAVPKHPSPGGPRTRSLVDAERKIWNERFGKVPIVSSPQHKKRKEQQQQEHHHHHHHNRRGRTQTRRRSARARSAATRCAASTTSSRSVASSPAK